MGVEPEKRGLNLKKSVESSRSAQGATPGASRRLVALHATESGKLGETARHGRVSLRNDSRQLPRD